MDFPPTIAGHSRTWPLVGDVAGRGRQSGPRHTLGKQKAFSDRIAASSRLLGEATRAAEYYSRRLFEESFAAVDDSATYFGGQSSQIVLME
jgi:hypothetical protein